jgi:WD40 repeat protein
MAKNPTDTLPPDQRVDAIVAEYLQAVRAGGAPDRRELLARHPDLAEELQSFFADHDLVRDLAEPLRLDAAHTPSPAGGDTATLSPETLPRRFGDYEILQEIARAGMGVVYRARQVSLDRAVALKMVQPSGRGPEDLERFLHTEARAVAGLDHPHIVPVYDFGTCEGRPFFSMKLIEGGSLDQHLARFAGDPKAAARLLATAARAVHHAHQRGLLHRDLKPANVLLDTEGRPLVTDFGLARRVEGGTGQTQEGAIIGTPAYMAPEQAAAAPVLTTAVDVYGLGAILYELLTGRPPFRGATVLDTLVAVRTQEPARPRALNPKADRDLETICLKSLEKDPAKRYGSAEALAEDLERWLHGEPIRARRAPVGRRVWKWCRRNPAWTAFVGVLCGSLIALSAFQAVSNAQLAEERNKAVAQKQGADNLRDEAEKAHAQEKELRQQAQEALARAETNLYYNRINLASQYWHGSKVGTAELTLDACPAELRNWEWHYLKRLCHAERLTLTRGNAVFDVAYSPDGKRLATTSGADLTLWDALTGKELLFLPGGSDPGQLTGVAFSSDGKRLAVAGGSISSRPANDGKQGKPEARGFVGIRDAVTGQELLTLHGHGDIAFGVAFSPDGTRLASAGGWGERPAELKVWDAATGKELLDLRGHTDTVWRVAFSPDGRYLASASKDGTARLWDAATGRELFALRGRDRAVVGLTFSPDGKRLATASAAAQVSKPAEVKVWDVATGQPVLGFRAHAGTIPCLAFSPDGKRLATGGADRVVKLWDAATGDELLTLRGHREFADVEVDRGGFKSRATSRGPDIGSVSSLAISPDGKRLASGGSDYTARVWDVTRDQEALALPRHSGSVVAFLPDSRRLVLRGLPTGCAVRDVTTGQVVLSLGTRQRDDVAISPDGRYLATASGVEGGAATLWDMATGKELHSLKGFGPAFSPDGRRLATIIGDRWGGSEQPSEVKVWDVVTGKELRTLRSDKWLISFVAFTPDGKQIITASTGGMARVWDADSGDEVRFFRFPHGNAVMLTPDGKYLASAGEDSTAEPPRVRIYELSSGREAATLTGHDSRISCLAYSPDGKRLATGSSDLTVKVWDPATGQEVLTLIGHTSAITGVAFSPDGRRLASSTFDEVKIWDATPLGEGPGSEPAPAEVHHEPTCRGACPDAGAVPRVPAPAGPAAARPAAARQAGPLGRGAADAARSLREARAVSGPQRGRVAGVAAAGAGAQPGRRPARVRPGQARCRPRALPGGGRRRVLVPAGRFPGGGAIVAEPAGRAARTRRPISGGAGGPAGRQPRGARAALL